MRPPVPPAASPVSDGHACLRRRPASDGLPALAATATSPGLGLGPRLRHRPQALARRDPTARSGLRPREWPWASVPWAAGPPPWPRLPPGPWPGVTQQPGVGPAPGCGLRPRSRPRCESRPTAGPAPTKAGRCRPWAQSRRCRRGFSQGRGRPVRRWAWPGRGRGHRPLAFARPGVARCRLGCRTSRCRPWVRLWFVSSGADGRRSSGRGSLCRTRSGSASPRRRAGKGAARPGWRAGPDRAPARGCRMPPWFGRSTGVGRPRLLALSGRDGPGFGLGRSGRVGADRSPAARLVRAGAGAGVGGRRPCRGWMRACPDRRQPVPTVPDRRPRLGRVGGSGPGRWAGSAVDRCPTGPAGGTGSVESRAQEPVTGRQRRRSVSTGPVGGLGPVESGLRSRPGAVSPRPGGRLPLSCPARRAGGPRGAGGRWSPRGPRTSVPAGACWRPLASPR